MRGHIKSKESGEDISSIYGCSTHPQLLGVIGGAGWIRARPPLATFGAGTTAGVSPLLLVAIGLEKKKTRNATI